MTADDEKLLTEWLLTVDRVHAALEAVTSASRTKVGLTAASAELSAALARLNYLAGVLDSSNVPAYLALPEV